jgi:hypothetical protein
MAQATYQYPPLVAFDEPVLSLVFPWWKKLPHCHFSQCREHMFAKDWDGPLRAALSVRLPQRPHFCDQNR